MTGSEERPTPAALLEQLIDSLMINEITERYPAAEVTRTSDGECVLDLGLANVYVVAVTERPR